MGMWSSVMRRSKTGELRREDDMTYVIKEFLNNQQNVSSYEIHIPGSPGEDWIVDVDGSLRIDDSDLPFKIGKLTGDLISTRRRLDSNILPNELLGSVIFVENEKDNTRSQNATAGNGVSTPEDLTMGLIRKKAENKYEEKELKDKCIRKLIDVLDDIDYHKLEIDVEEIIKTFREKKAASKNIDYKLIIDIEGDLNKSKYYKRCDIYISEDRDTPISFRAIDKAVYLAFLSLDKTFDVDGMQPSFTKLVRNIYTKLPNDRKASDFDKGIAAPNMRFKPSWLRERMKDIKDQFKARIYDREIVEKFAIVGKKRGEPVDIQMNTDEIRKQVKDAFNI